MLKNDEMEMIYLRKQTFWILVLAMLMVLSACSGKKEAVVESKTPVKDMADQMLEKVEQPPLIELEKENVKNMYHLDPSLLEEYTIRMPMMNVKTNEMAILKVKNEKDLQVVKEALQQRAKDVQKLFETYLPDQYENAKNYKIMTKGNYVFFVISDKADVLVKEFNTFFEAN